MGTKGCGTQSRLGIAGSAQKAMREGRITQELVTEVADKVYAMLSLELRIEKERHRLPDRGLFYGQRGW